MHDILFIVLFNNYLVFLLKKSNTTNIITKNKNFDANLYEWTYVDKTNCKECVHRKVWNRKKNSLLQNLF